MEALIDTSVPSFSEMIAGTLPCSKGAMTRTEDNLKLALE